MNQKNEITDDVHLTANYLCENCRKTMEQIGSTTVFPVGMGTVKKQTLFYCKYCNVYKDIKTTDYFIHNQDQHLFKCNDIDVKCSCCKKYMKQTGGTIQEGDIRKRNFHCLSYGCNSVVSIEEHNMSKVIIPEKHIDVDTIKRTQEHVLDTMEKIVQKIECIDLKLMSHDKKLQSLGLFDVLKED